MRGLKCHRMTCMTKARTPLVPSAAVNLSFHATLFGERCGTSQKNSAGETETPRVIEATTQELWRAAERGLS